MTIVYIVVGIAGWFALVLIVLGVLSWAAEPFSPLSEREAHRRKLEDEAIQASEHRLLRLGGPR